MRKKIEKKYIISLEDKKAADAQIKECQKQIEYDTKDYTIELLVEKFKKNEFFIPKYQRNYIWRDKNKNLFLESVFLGLPIPFMFFADSDDGRQEIIDGAQRMQTLVSFCNNEITLQGLKKLTKLNGFSFKDLSESQQRKFVNRSLRIIVLQEDTPAESRQDLFYRINTTGLKANDSEIRRGSYPGPFTDFIEECANDETFVKLCPMSENSVMRHERFESILRFFAYTNAYQQFKHNVNEFLNNYLMNNLDTFEREDYKREFNNVMHFVQAYYPYGFAKSAKAKSTPRVRFEALSVGTALALRLKPDISNPNLDWMDSKEFHDLTTSDASNNEGRLKLRVEYVRDHLLKG